MVHLFRRQLRQHFAQHAFERLLCDERDLVHRRAEKALHRVAHVRGVARDLHVGDGVHVERDAALRVRALHADLDGEEPHVHARDVLQQRHPKPAPTVQHLVSDLRAVLQPMLAAREDQNLVRLAHVEKIREQPHEDAERDEDEDSAAEENPRGLHVEAAELFGEPAGGEGCE